MPNKSIFVPNFRKKTMRTTYNIGGMPHLERLRLGAKYIPCGEHRNQNFHDREFSELSITSYVEDL